jgi:hypothetical protein
MKICTLILTYDLPLYNYFDNIKRAYLDKQQEDYIFVYNGTDTTKHNPEAKTYNYFSDAIHPSGIPMMFDKFVDVVKSGAVDEYDFVIRVNSSTFINTDVIRKHLQGKTDNVYMGFFHPDWNFVSGACMIFSKDVLRKLADNTHNVHTGREDDLVIGDLMRHLNVPKTFLDRYCFETHIQDTHTKVPSEEILVEALKYPQIRIRNNSDRDKIDKGIWDIISKLVL